MRISFYADRQRVSGAGGDTSYLFDALTEYFDVTLHSEPDAELCRRADVVFVRFSRSRPTPARFLRELGGHKDKLFINPPESLLALASKRHLLIFPHLTLPTIITRSRPSILRFARRHGVIVLKPLDSHSGKGVVKIDCTSKSDAEIWAAVTERIEQHGTPVVQAYVDRVREWGDKRVNVFAYEAISAVRTLPAEGSFICHRSAGGRELAAGLSDRDLEIVNEVIPFLRRHQIWWAGIDIIGPYLGEINVFSPMMIRRADEAHGTTCGKRAVVRLLNRYAKRHAV
jgi:glutathione synthase